MHSRWSLAHNAPRPQLWRTTPEKFIRPLTPVTPLPAISLKLRRLLLMLIFRTERVSCCLRRSSQSMWRPLTRKFLSLYARTVLVDGQYLAIMVLPYSSLQPAG